MGRKMPKLIAVQNSVSSSKRQELNSEKLAAPSPYLLSPHPFYGCAASFSIPEASLISNQATDWLRTHLK